MKKFVKLASGMLACVMLAGCGAQTYSDDAIVLDIENTAENLLSISVTYYVGDTFIATATASNSDGSLLSPDDYIFDIEPEEIPDGSDLSDFSVQFDVKEEDGDTITVTTLDFAAASGTEYDFQLNGSDGSYSVLTGFQGASVAAETTASTSDLYAPVLEQYNNAITANTDVETLMDSDINYLIGMYSFDNKADAFGYCLADINNDGVNELVIGATADNQDEFMYGLVLQVFAISNGAPVQVLSSSERDRYYFLGDAKFANVGSSGAEASIDTTLQISGASLTDLGYHSDTTSYTQIQYIPFSSYGG